MASVDYGVDSLAKMNCQQVFFNTKYADKTSDWKLLIVPHVRIAIVIVMLAYTVLLTIRC